MSQSVTLRLLSTSYISNSVGTIHKYESYAPAYKMLFS